MTQNFENFRLVLCCKNNTFYFFLVLTRMFSLSVALIKIFLSHYSFLVFVCYVMTDELYISLCSLDFIFTKCLFHKLCCNNRVAPFAFV